MAITYDQQSEGIRPGHNVLVLCPTFSPEKTQLCRDLVVGGPEEACVLSVLCTKSPRERIARLEDCVGTEPSSSAIISADSSVHSAHESGAEHGGKPASEVSVTRIQSLEELTKLGVRITTQIEAWQDERGDEQIVLCLESLTALAQYNSEDRLLSFVDALTGKVADVDGVGHYHADPVAHDDEQIDQLRAAFDGVFEWEGGSWSRPMDHLAE